MKKSGVMSCLAQLKAESEQKTGEELETMPLQLIVLLLGYINDPEITEAVNAINF